MKSPSNLLFSLRVPAQADRLRLIRASTRDALSALGCSPNWTRDMLIAIDEACQNVVRHAYGDKFTGDMVVEARIMGKNLEILLRDFAPCVDPATVKPRDLNDIRPGGLGTHFIREVTDLCGFLDPPVGGGNLFRMVKSLECLPGDGPDKTDTDERKAAHEPECEGSKDGASGRMGTSSKDAME
ncbi:ATP-binding protein [Rhodospirillum sp. A1_3_36]|uniref:ATP-binding protein n=1 Tax=Rhodospirillum sp. A1_3_36 TaxID=3391666 RepID=UPI0039A4C0BE